MIIETANPTVAGALAATQSLLESHGAYFAEDLTIVETDGHFRCALAAPETRPGRVLVAYDPGLRVPMRRIRWASESDGLEADLSDLSPVHAALAEHWLEMVTATNKVQRTVAALPSLSLEDPVIRHELRRLDHIDGPRSAAAGRRALVAMHSAGGPGGPHLIPIKSLVDHSHHGSSQTAVPGQVSVVSHAGSGPTGTFEYYGDHDAMGMWLAHGVVDTEIDFVYGVPTTVDVGQATLQVRQPGVSGRRQPPPLAVTACDEGLILEVAFKSSTLEEIIAMLAMALATRLGLSSIQARSTAQSCLELVHQESADFYRKLESLTRNSDSLPPNHRASLKTVIEHQRRILTGSVRRG